MNDEKISVQTPVNEYYATYTPPVITPEQKKQKAQFFEMMILPTILYALVYTFCCFDNWGSILTPVYVLATIIYCSYVLKKLHVDYKGKMMRYSAVMILLGISSFLTGNWTIQFFNSVGIVLVLICMLLHVYFDDKEWKLGKYAGAIGMMFVGTLLNIAEIFSDVSCYQKNNKGKKHTALMYVLIGILISIPLLLVIVGLLYSADLVFAMYLNEINIDAFTIFRQCVLMAMVFWAAYGGIKYLESRSLDASTKPAKQYNVIVAATILSMISVVYLFFSLIQIVYLFLGKMQLPAEYTYAQYAHEGFFQLLFVCIINVVIVVTVLNHFPQHVFLKVLLTVISLCTYIMLISSAFRLSMYVACYKLTFLRILAYWAIAVIALLMVGVLLQIYKVNFPLFRYGFAVVCVCYLVLSFAHVDYWIVKYNLRDVEVLSEYMDDSYTYLGSLSTDAAPALAPYKEDAQIEQYAEHVEFVTEGESFRQFNLSHAIAKQLFLE